MSSRPGPRRPSPRNGPTQDFFRRFFGDELREGLLEISAELFEERCPALFHEVNEQKLRERQIA